VDLSRPSSGTPLLLAPRSELIILTGHSLPLPLGNYSVSEVPALKVMAYCAHVVSGVTDLMTVSAAQNTAAKQMHVA